MSNYSLIKIHKSEFIPDQREDQSRSPTKKGYTRHEVTAPRAVGPSGRTMSFRKEAF